MSPTRRQRGEGSDGEDTLRHNNKGGPMREPTEAQIDAALKAAYGDWVMPYGARVGDFIQSPTDPPPGPERDAAMAALRAADEDANQKNRDAMREILRAALNA